MITAAALREQLAPFCGDGALAGVDLHVVAALAALTDERDPEVLLALALTSRAPRHGHVAVDLLTMGDDDLFADEDPDRAPPPWPADRAAWLARTQASPLVASAGEPGRAFVLDDSLLYTRRYHDHQQRLASSLSARFATSLPLQDAALLSRGLDALFPGDPRERRQRLAAATACLRGLTVITGGPGTGKTHTVRNVLTLLWAQRRGELRVALAAPTGKAAARVKESLGRGLAEHAIRAVPALDTADNPEALQRFVADLAPSTLHRLLGWNPHNPTRFRHDASNPLPYDVVVVDEASMVDLALMARLVDAVAPDTRLILLGDRHQLASVEAGSVLADLCGPHRVEREEPSVGFIEELGAVSPDLRPPAGPAHAEAGPWDCIVQLDHSRRFHDGSGVGALARACLAGDDDAAVALLASGSPFPDAEGLPHEGGRLDARARAALVAGYRPYLRHLQAGPGGGDLEAHHAEALRLLDGFRALCAHRRGPLGAEGVNALVSAALLEEGLRPASGQAFWPGLPVLVRRNDYSVRRFNGDIGLVVEGPGGLVVAFAEEDGRISYLAPSRLPEHQPVFAMTIHKSQGSEFDHALVILPDRPSPILTRELVYTGVTRARDRVSVAFGAPVLRAALRARVRRASGLEAALWKSGTPKGDGS